MHISPRLSPSRLPWADDGNSGGILVLALYPRLELHLVRPEGCSLKAWWSGEITQRWANVGQA